MSPPGQTEKKKPACRQKIKLEKIENPAKLQVTFSKRRGGLFKKASELCTLTGAEVGIITFSPSGKPYSFSHPNMETVMNKFLPNGTEPNIAVNQKNEGHRAVHVNQMNQEVARIEMLVESEKRRGIELDRNFEIGQAYGKFPSIEKMNLDQLIELKQSILDLEQKIENGNTSLPEANPKFDGSGGFSFGSRSTFPRFDVGGSKSQASFHGGAGGSRLFEPQTGNNSTFNQGPF